MTESTLDAFTTELQRLYYFEREIDSELDVLVSDVSIDSLDNIQVTACREQLRERVESHRDETESHCERLEEVFDAIDKEPNVRPTPKLSGWTADKERFNNIILNDELRPLYYLDATKKLEEIERSAYEPVLALAEKHEDEAETAGIVDPLEQNYEEEREMLEDLESISDSKSVESLLEASPVDPTDRSSLGRSGMNIERLEDLFIYQLWNVYYIERKLALLFEGMAIEEPSDELREAFIEYQALAQSRMNRLEQVFEAVGPQPTENQSHTLDDLIKSRQDRLESTSDGSVDLIDLETALTVERIERRCYEALLPLVDRIGHPDDVVDLLAANLDEGQEMIKKLEGIQFRNLIQRSSERTTD